MSKKARLNPVGMLREAQVAQHHDAGQQQRRGVGLVLAGNVRSSPVYRLHQRQAVCACARQDTAVSPCWTTLPKHDSDIRTISGDVLVYVPGMPRSSRCFILLCLKDICPICSVAAACVLLRLPHLCFHMRIVHRTQAIHVICKRLTDIGRWCETQATDEASTEV